MPYKNTHTNPNTTFIYVLQSGDEIRYVGKTDNPRARIFQHKTKSGFKNPHLHRWMKKAGDVCLNVIDEVPKENWVFWEKWYIQLFKSWSFKLVNLTEGGDGFDGYKHTQEVLEKMRKNRVYLRGEQNPMYGIRGEDHPHFGRKHSAESLLKMSVRQLGEKNHRYGKKCIHSKETIEKCSEAKKAAWANGVYGSDEYRQKMRDAHLGKPKIKLRKPIKCNETGKVYSCAKEAAITITGKESASGNICSQLKGKVKRVYGHTFSYLNN